jgi:hypothetical protein
MPLLLVQRGQGRGLLPVRAPNAEAAEALHREAHGNVADEIVEVKKVS